MKFALYPFATLLLGLGCSQYTTAKTWADTVCDVVHALPESSASRLSPSMSVVVVADSASVHAKVIAPSSASARLINKDIDVGY